MYKFGWKKGLATIPAFLTLCLVSYISYTFLHEFQPEKYGETWSTGRICNMIVFVYFSLMTYVFVIKVLLSDPGYVDAKYGHPRDENGYAPTNELRIHNLRFI